MSPWTAEDVARHNAKIGAKMPAHVPAKSKYRNVRTVAGGIIFDSKREADYWILLKARESAGEITDLQRQVRFGLWTIDDADNILTVCDYIADFVYCTRDAKQHVVDAKGKRTQMYALKKKWLELQSGVIIEEV